MINKVGVQERRRWMSQGTGGGQFESKGRDGEKVILKK